MLNLAPKELWNNPKHIQDNLAARDFTLSEEDMALLDKRAASGKRQRVTRADIGFTDEFDFTYEECWPKK